MASKDAAAFKITDITAVLRCKVAVMGDQMVGKSSLISMFSSKGTKFPKTYTMTTGVEVVVVQVPVPDTTVIVELYLHDTGGCDLYKDKDALPAFWNGVYYTMVVIDVTNQESFNNCESLTKGWLEELKRARVDKERPIKGVVCCNKVDLPSQRHRVPMASARDWAVSNGLEFFETSAVPPGQNVDKAFEALAKMFHKAYEEKVKTFQDVCSHY